MCGCIGARNDHAVQRYPPGCIVDGAAVRTDDCLVSSNAVGVKLVIAAEDTQPALDVVLPDGPGVVMKIVFPEHVTVRQARRHRGRASVSVSAR